jgi:hypothetical protein
VEVLAMVGKEVVAQLSRRLQLQGSEQPKIHAFGGEGKPEAPGIG